MLTDPWVLFPAGTSQRIYRNLSNCLSGRLRSLSQESVRESVNLLHFPLGLVYFYKEIKLKRTKINH